MKMSRHGPQAVLVAAGGFGDGTKASLKQRFSASPCVMKAGTAASTILTEPQT